MPARGPADLLERLLTRFAPVRTLSPAEVLHHRVITGGALLGLAVAVPAGWISWLDGAHAGAKVIVAFGVGCLGLLVAARVGAPMRWLRAAGFWLVNAFLVLACLQSSALRWEQFKWLAVVPLLELFLDETTPEGGRLRGRFHGLWRGTAIAFALALCVIAANQLGWTFAEEETTGALGFTMGVTDFVLFIVSVAGLLSIHGVALQRAQEELRLLRSMLSVCAWCRRIRDTNEEWVDLERYVATHTQTNLTHGICPACADTALSETGRR